APLLAAIFRTRTTRDWVEALEAAGVPNGPINTIAQVFEEPQVVARGMRIELPHPLAGSVPLVRSPVVFSETPLEHRLPPPTLGQHTEEILREMLAMSEAGIAQLRADGVI
ncbi:MAG: CoA transferase, partial [Betaproteobacteria bacterium]|nr:CoA transferase [Betaproteobacteria bacterium]